MPLSSSKEINPQPQEPAPPKYADLFQIARLDETQAPPNSPSLLLPDSVKVGAPSTEIVVPTGAEFLCFFKGERSGDLAAAALGVKGPAYLPQIYSESDAQRFARFVELNADELKRLLKKEGAEEQKHALAEVDFLFKGGRETCRRQILLRWFRDPVTPADLNPNQFVDRRAEKRGNIFQLLHPALFNILMSFFLLIVTFLVFANCFRETR